MAPWRRCSTNLTWQFNTTTGVLSLTGLAPVSTYAQALASIVYRNTRDEPNPSMRVVSFVVSDGLLLSIPRVANVTIVMTNDLSRLFFAASPVNTNTTVTFVEDQGVVAVLTLLSRTTTTCSSRLLLSR
jgi:hypothetical protein